MTSTSETGHAKNVATFDQLISFVTGYGATYNPSKAAIKLKAMQTLATQAKDALNQVNAALPAYNTAVAARVEAFEPLSKYITRVSNALKATDASPKIVETAKSLVRKIQGTRATAKKTPQEIEAEKAEGKETREISSSQMSYDNRLDNLDKLIKLLAGVTQYAPNEPELKVASLTSLYNDLRTKNAAVVTVTAPLSNARIARNRVLYKENIGLVDVAADAKTYIKSVYGATSSEFKQVSALEFKALKF